MPLVAGIDSSTQSCKVVVQDADSGEVVRSGRAPHPDGSEVDPEAWWAALDRAASQAGGLADVASVAVAGQQHGMVALDQHGQVVRPALLWNDTRSAPQAERLIRDLGGPQPWADATGLVPVASFTITKLAWMAEHEPDNARRTTAVCLPHDWLTWRLAGAEGLDALATDRGDASGTGYFSGADDSYRRELLSMALGHDAILPTVLGPHDRAGQASGGALVGPGTGDNMAAALGLGAGPGDVIVSVGTSGVVSAVSAVPAHDPTGTVAGFADATGRFLPLVCTLNAARVLDATASVLGVGLDQLAEMALASPPGSDGLVLVPYLEGERTPNRPTASGALHGVTLRNLTPPNVARAAFEGILCGLAEGLDALAAYGDAHRVILVGGGARSSALREIAPTVFGHDTVVPPPGEYVAVGAAHQAAWVLAGGGVPPDWTVPGTRTYRADPVPSVRERYQEARALFIDRHA